jgi:formylglycine-generating enzyme required for sulfatase activity
MLNHKKETVLRKITMLLCLAVAVSALAQGNLERQDSSRASTGMKFLRTNDKGFDEFLWLEDSSVVIKIPAGKFTMGSPEDEDVIGNSHQHEASLSGYYLDKCEVTNRQYKRFCDATSYGYPPDPGFSGKPSYFTNYLDFPVVSVSWDDAIAYCAWAGKRLPTEAEWEKAARGADARQYPWGNGDPDSTFTDGGYQNDGHLTTSPVGYYPSGASPYGCMDMAGNVWEWCSDWYDGSYYSGSPTNDPQGPSSGSDRVIRGGGWCNLLAWNVRCAERNRGVPAERDNYLGFRCAHSE